MLSVLLAQFWQLPVTRLWTSPTHPWATLPSEVRRGVPISGGWVRVRPCWGFPNPNCTCARLNRKTHSKQRADPPSTLSGRSARRTIQQVSMATMPREVHSWQLSAIYYPAIFVWILGQQPKSLAQPHPAVFWERVRSWRTSRRHL